MYARNRITVAETASWASPIWGLDLSYRCVRYLRRWCSLRDALMFGTGFVARSWSASALLVCTSKGSTEPARSTQTRPPRRRRHELVLGSAGRTSDRYVRPTPASVGTPPRAVPGCFVAALSSPATYQIAILARHPQYSPEAQQRENVMPAAVLAPSLPSNSTLLVSTVCCAQSNGRELPGHQHPHHLLV